MYIEDTKELKFVQRRMRGPKGDLKPHQVREGWQNWVWKLGEEKVSREHGDCPPVMEGQLCEDGWDLRQWVELPANLVLTCSLGKYFLDTYSVPVLN